MPDLSDTQVIVYTEYPGQAPQVVEDQVTYPLTTALLAVPRAKVVRGFSFFGVSFVYVIFEDGTDLYWARSRVLEYLNSAAKRSLPAGVTPTLGPDATGRRLGVPVRRARRTRARSAELRTIQDWYLRYAAAEGRGRGRGRERRRLRPAIPGRRRSAELQAYGITLAQVTRRASAAATATSAAAWSRWPRPNSWCAAAAICEASTDHRADRRSKAQGGTPVLLRDVARVELGPDERRGIAELNGEGEVVGGIVVQRVRPERART